KITITKVPVPVAYGPAFEGERIRKADVHCEFGGNKTTAFEFVTSLELDEINDGEIEIIGPDIDTVEEGSALPLAIWVEVAGRKLQADFEPILERQIHHLLNGAEGIWHMGQRDIVWTRVSKDGFKQGLRLKHYGEILHAKLLSEYPAIVDKVKVTLVTDEAEVEKRIVVARKVYDERNRRLEAMTDDSVDTFYSCLLCQSFAPDHVCIISPERLGLCGAYNWLDGKAAYEIDETGPNQPVKKGECLDPVKGVWKGINEYVHTNSHKAIESFSAYSLMNNPMTSCGCFEVICAYVPECNGVMVVNREYQGETPIGMTFSALAGSVGGGQQTPGFMGCGKVFLTSKKFLYAEGGYKRLVWMPKELKELLQSDLEKRFEEQDAVGLMDKIADETMAIEANDVRAFIEKVKHPVLEMDDMSLISEEAPSVSEIPEEESTNSDSTDSPSAATNNEDPAEHGETIEKLENPTKVDLDEIKKQIKKELLDETRQSITEDVVKGIIGSLSQNFLGGSFVPSAIDTQTMSHERSVAHAPTNPQAQPQTAQPPPAPESIESVEEKLSKVKSFKIPQETCEVPVWKVRLGATKAEGGTRTVTHEIGGAT
ncbi:MAG: CO dehydrogenase/CO-methylating acetyl-CoA synthase complex subunit beta, partial [Kiritimatiellaeota bacterium]|nr:CO dehydrogenase/CO-methylating acetyl-CoA synthase complex subunit beta [Kiritimatiellota bacterium]